MIANAERDWIIIGQFGRAHGVSGWITVHSFTEPRDNLLDYVNWHVLRATIVQPIDLRSIELRSNRIVAQIVGYNTREDVAALTNLQIAIYKEQLSVLAAGEYYWHELVGMEVWNQRGMHFGKVHSLIPTGAHDVLVVHGAKTYLIPYVIGRYIVQVNKADRRIIVDWEDDFLCSA